MGKVKSKEQILEQMFEQVEAISVDPISMVHVEPIFDMEKMTEMMERAAYSIYRPMRISINKNAGENAKAIVINFDGTSVVFTRNNKGVWFTEKALVVTETSRLGKELTDHYQAYLLKIMVTDD